MGRRFLLVLFALNPLRYFVDVLAVSLAIVEHKLKMGNMAETAILFYVVA
jgi:hypothetical protein